MWEIETTETYKAWHYSLSDKERARIVGMLKFLQEEGPMLGRPYADSVKGSRFSHMKELRVQSQGDPIRIFFAFSPNRTSVLLCAGNKSRDDKRFYEVMIPRADREYAEYLNNFYQSR